MILPFWFFSNKVAFRSYKQITKEKGKWKEKKLENNLPFQNLIPNFTFFAFVLINENLKTQNLPSLEHYNYESNLNKQFHIANIIYLVNCNFCLSIFFTEIEYTNIASYKLLY